MADTPKLSQNTPYGTSITQVILEPGIILQQISELVTMFMKPLEDMEVREPLVWDYSWRPTNKDDTSTASKQGARRIKVFHSNLNARSVDTSRMLYAHRHGHDMHKEAIERIACMLEVPRWSLNIEASPKGLVAGCLAFRMRNGAVIESGSAGSDLTMMNVMNVDDIVEIIGERPQFVLIVEKEASFRNLISSGILGHFSSCVAITGRGVPDYATRRFAHFLYSKFPGIPFMCLTDCDPYGIEIYRLFANGVAYRESQIRSDVAHEAMRRAMHVPNLAWVGVHSKEWLFDQERVDRALTMSSYDLQRAKSMLARPESWFGDDIGFIKSELITMIESRKKAELQILDDHRETFVSTPYTQENKRSNLISIIQSGLDNAKQAATQASASTASQ